MFSVDEEATIVGVAELRSRGAKLLNELKDKRIILTRRNEPAAVMLSIDEFRRLKALAEESEDLYLESIAHERDRTGKKSDYISHDKVKAKLGL
jgi:prevent-host-death family protein